MCYRREKFVIVSVMTLPREFRRPRVLLLGFGDVAKRLAHQRLSQTFAGHGPRFIAVSRSKAAQADEALTKRISATRSLWLAWSLDNRAKTKQLASIGQMAIVFAPPAESSLHDRDLRSRKLALAIRGAGKRVPLVYISTTGVYGDQRGGMVTEHSTCRPSQARSRRRLDAERCLRALGGHILRTPGIYAQDRLPIARLRAQTPALSEQEDVFTNHIHADDLATISWLALFRGRPTRVTNAVDHTRMTMGEYFDAVAQAFDLPKAPRVSLQEMKALAKQGVISPMALSFFLESRQVRSLRLESELGVRLAYPTVTDCLKKAAQTKACG